MVEQIGGFMGKNNQLQVEVSSLKLDNPIIPASGTFAFGQEFSEFYDLNILGSISIKGTTLDPREGNSSPRIAECPSGMLNSVGLENPGSHRVVNEYLPEMARIFNKPVIANVSGFSIDQYVKCAEVLDKAPNVGLLEINISCPNVHGGGMAFGLEPSMARKVTSEVKKVCKKPVYIKLSPNVTSIVEIAKACEAGGADGLSLVNTFLGMRINLKTGKPILANTFGGLSGPAIFPIALRMVYQVYEACDIPIIGMGGISSAEDVLEMMMAGASCVQIGAANLVDPYACPKIINSLPKILEKYEVDNISELVGRAHQN